jgi:hypothetical protein
MTDSERIELLAQALWLRTFGLRRLTPQWQAFAAVNATAAAPFRTKAAAMLDTAQGAITGAPGRKRPHSSLGWLA